LASSDYHLFGPLKDHLRGDHYETDEAVQEAMRSWLRGAGTDFTAEAFLRFCNPDINA
jgi:nucleoside-specific outer membrane channel protein Tsx